MRKGLFLLIIMVSFLLQARIVEENDFVTNKGIIENEIQRLFNPPNSLTIDINRIFPLEQDGYVVGWIVNLQPEGWFLASAHTEGSPFILFSDDGSFSDSSFSDDSSSEIKEFFEIHKKYLFIEQYKLGYIITLPLTPWISSSELNSIIFENSVKLGNLRNWSRLNIFSPEYSIIEPYLSSFKNEKVVLSGDSNKWGQGGSYNNYLPYCGSGEVYVGCNPLAHAQVMRLWKYPSSFEGTAINYYDNDGYQAPYNGVFSYDYNEMPLNEATSQVKAFLYDISVSGKTDWGCDGSGASHFNLRTALIENFSYSGELKTVASEYLFKYDPFITVKRNVDKGFPTTLSLSTDDPDDDGHAISCIGYSIENENRYLRVNLGWNSNNKWWNISKSLEGYTIINGINENIYPADFCGFESIDSENFDGYYEKCYERKQANIDGHAIILEDDGTGLTIDQCPSTFNPGQFVKYWCPDKDEDGVCDSIKKEDVIRYDCAEDTICMLDFVGKCLPPVNYIGSGEWNNLGTHYRPCRNLTLKECVDRYFDKRLNLNGKKYTLYKIYDQLLDDYKIKYYTSTSYNDYNAGYANSDFFDSSLNLRNNLCMSRRYELDSNEFYENCIEGDGENVPECEGQCEFTYSKIGSHRSKECPPCLTENEKVMSVLNPGFVPDEIWKKTYSFRMCPDIDGDGVCDTSERFVCGTDNYFWYDICENPYKYKVLPSSYAFSDDVDNCMSVYNPDQEDWNDDLVGNACDFDGDGVTDNNDIKVYYSQGGSEKLNFESPDEGFENHKECVGDAMTGFCRGTGWYGRTLNISGFVGIKDSGKDVSRIEAKFCYCGETSFQHALCETQHACGRNHARPESPWNELDNRAQWQSANKQVLWNREYIESIPSVMVDSKSQTIWYNTGKPHAPQIDTGIRKGNFSWDWKYRDHPVLSGITQVVAQSKTQKESIIETGNYPALRLSFAPVNKISIPYISDDHNINFARYENYYQNASDVTKLRSIDYAFSDKEMIDLIIEKRSTSGYAWWLPSLPPYWWHLLDGYLRPGLGDYRPMPGDPWDWSSSVNSLADAHIRPGEFTSVSFTENTMVLNSLKNENPYQQAFKFGNADFIYAFEDQNFVLKMANEAGFFETQTVVQNGIDMKSAAVLVDGNKIFMAGNMITAPNQPAINELNTTFENKFVSIDVTASGAVMNVLASFPSTNNVQFLKLIKLNGNVFIISESSSGLMELFKYSSEANSWQVAASQQLNTPVALNNGMVKDEHFYLPVKQDQSNTEILAFDGTDFFSFATIEKPYDAYLKLFPKNENIIAVVTNLLTENRVPAYEISTGGINEISIPAIKAALVLFDPEFCIYENNNSIFPGTTNESGECISVYDYNYETVSYFDYKYTVAGYKNNLYLGGLTGVRRVEIRDDGSLVNRDMLYTGETNNLAVYGNTMYGANYGEVDIYSIAENGSVSRVKGIGSSSCGNVRVSEDRLFTAENKRVRIFDISNPQSPVLIKTIATSGKVIDLEVVDNRLYIYEETTSWFTTKGFTGIYDITNLNSPVRTKYFEKRCTDTEMQKSGPSTGSGQGVYLGCKNGQFRVTNTGLSSLTGKKDYVREGYSYNGTLYQVFSGYLHLSRTSTIQAVCGNGVMEPGEVCDSDILQCSELDTEYIGGIAACNSTCDGYNETNCEADGW